MAVCMPANLSEVQRVYGDCVRVVVTDAVMTAMCVPDDAVLRRIGLYHVFTQAVMVANEASAVLTSTDLLPPASVRWERDVVVVGDYAELCRGNTVRWTGLADDETVTDALRDGMRAMREQFSAVFADANVRLLPWALCIVHEMCTDPLYAERSNSAREPAVLTVPPSPELPVSVVPPQPAAAPDPDLHVPFTATDLAVIHDRMNKMSTTARAVKVDNMCPWYAASVVTVDTRNVTEAGWPHAQFVSVHHVLLLLVPAEEREQRTRQFVALVRHGVVDVYRFSARHLRRVTRSGDAVSRAYPNALVFVDVRDLALMLDDTTQSRPAWDGRTRVPDDLEVDCVDVPVRYSPDLTTLMPCLVHGDVRILPLNVLMRSAVRRHIERDARVYTVPACVGARMAAWLRERDANSQLSHKVEHGFYGMDSRDLFPHERVEQ
jgi:hypothetical protein